MVVNISDLDNPDDDISGTEAIYLCEDCISDVCAVARDEDQAALPSVSNAAEIEDEISIIRHVQRQQVQQASYTGPAENTRPRLRDNRCALSKC